MMKAQKGLPVIGKPFFVLFDARHGRHAMIATRDHDSFVLPVLFWTQSTD
jgi:hypothetical protein